VEPFVIVPLPATVERSAAFAPLAGVPPLIRVVRSMSGATSRARLVVASAPALADDAAECLRAAGLGDVSTTAARDPGARRDVLTAALDHLRVQRDSDDVVLLCDCRYPLSPAIVAERVIAALGHGHDVVVPTQPVTDTVKTIDASGAVLGTVDRTTLRTVQYPRGFTAAALWHLIASRAVDDLDDLDAAFGARLDVTTVAGDPNAFQVELPRDTPLLEAIIASAQR
jgi:2-C-methyl-D-erythritol 4-phosphate cytidylyltransferase